MTPSHPEWKSNRAWWLPGKFGRVLRQGFYVLAGVFSASLGLKGFLLPNSFLDGGVTGISLIAAELSPWSLSVWIILINLPFLIMGFSTIGKRFAFKSMGAITLLAVVLHVIPFESLTQDTLLIAIFGGFFLGLGIGLAVRGGAVIDGTEVLAVFLSRRLPMSIGDIILVFNVLIFSVAAYVFDFETALYGILTYLVASKTVDYVITGIEEYVGVSIISDKSEELRHTIVEKMKRGCTLYNGKKGYTREGASLKETEIVFTLITRLELSKLQKEIDGVDPHAFVIIQSVKDVRGGLIKQRPLK